MQVINEDSGYYATISVDDPQRVSRVGAGEDSVQEYLNGGRGVRFQRPKRDKKHPESYIMFFVWVFLYCLILGKRRARTLRTGSVCADAGRRERRCTHPAPVQLIMAGLAWFSVGFIPIARVYFTVGKLLIMVRTVSDRTIQQRAAIALACDSPATTARSGSALAIALQREVAVR